MLLIPEPHSYNFVPAHRDGQAAVRAGFQRGLFFLRHVDLLHLLERFPRHESYVYWLASDIVAAQQPSISGLALFDSADDKYSWFDFHE